MKTIAFFDLETTGLDTQKDRIVEIAIVIFDLESKNTVEEFHRIINPGIKIPEKVSEIHGIYDKDVKDADTFNQVAGFVAEMLGGAVLAGHNVKGFDIPMLMSEFERAGVDFDFSDVVIYDTLEIERKVNSYQLGKVYKRRTGRTLDDAHNALADTYASCEVFKHQLHQDIDPEIWADSDINKINEFITDGVERCDIAGKIAKDGEDYVWTFGKNKGKKVKDTTDYCKWVLNADFPSDTKKFIKKILM